jgi:hypothetical protein
MTGRGSPPLGACKWRSVAAHGPDLSRDGPRSGELSGGNRIGRLPLSRSRGTTRAAGRASAWSCQTVMLDSAPSGVPPPLALAKDSYLVDSASSHMLVSKIKPCMSKYKQLYRETANGSLNQLSFI